MSLFGRKKPQVRSEGHRRRRLGVIGGREAAVRDARLRKQVYPVDSAPKEHTETPFVHNLKTGRMKVDLPLPEYSDSAQPPQSVPARKPRLSSSPVDGKLPKKKKKKQKPIFVIPLWAKGLGVLGLILFIVLCFYILLPDVAQDKLSISSVNVAAMPEQIRDAVKTALDEELGKQNVLYNFDLSSCESHLRLRFPQLQNLKLSLSMNQNAEFVLYATGSLREQAAIARNSNAFYLVDPTGFVVGDIPLSRLGEFNLPHVTCVSDFPLAVGQQCDSEPLKTSLSLLSAIRDRDRDFYKHIQEVAVVFRREEETTSIAVLCDGGLEVRFSDISPIDELKKFRTFTEAASKIKNLEPYSEVAYVDMRYRRQLPFMPRSVQRTQMQLPQWVTPILDKTTTMTVKSSSDKSSR